ncbi:hypothetical protein PEC301879_30450 [Pectobacterium carotovorum subsp. carotovorum]|nr:hypothetical protein PEC301879_30450 [Pectobacterium carotovorum subsp. carotovorum]
MPRPVVALDISIFPQRFYVFVSPSLHLSNVALLLVFELAQNAIHLRYGLRCFARNVVAFWRGAIQRTGQPDEANHWNVRFLRLCDKFPHRAVFPLKQDAW